MYKLRNKKVGDCMKILIINPNSDPKMTEAIAKTAVDFAGEKYEVVCLPTPGAPKYIETYEDVSLSAPGMLHRCLPQ